jgi:hypothetical protein
MVASPSAGSNRGVPRLGEGWASLARELEERLHEIDPDVVLISRIDAVGLLRFDLGSRSAKGAECAALVREYEATAVETCEACGRSGRLQSGVMVTVRCVECAG